MVSRRGLAIDGVLLLDKPAGLSSNHALQRARRILNARKAGHTGTLDPFATGLMVLCFGEATKYSAGMFEADKRYLATLQLGHETDSGDVTGTPLHEPGSVVADVATVRSRLADDAALHAVLSRFTGTMAQVPPMYSALKRDGKPLYAYARQGIELEREPRQVTIHDLVMRGRDVAAGQLVLEVSCSKGTYVRTLAQDIGRALGLGAHLVGLRRLSTAGFVLEQAATLEQLEALANPQSALHPVESLLQAMPVAGLDADTARRFSLGQTVPAPAEWVGRRAGGHPQDARTLVRVHAPDQHFLGTACLAGKWLKPDRLMAFNKESST